MNWVGSRQAKQAETRFGGLPGRTGKTGSKRDADGRMFGGTEVRLVTLSAAVTAPTAIWLGLEPWWWAVKNGKSISCCQDALEAGRAHDHDIISCQSIETLRESCSPIHIQKPRIVLGLAPSLVLALNVVGSKREETGMGPRDWEIVRHPFSVFAWPCTTQDRMQSGPGCLPWGLGDAGTGNGGGAPASTSSARPSRLGPPPQAPSSVGRALDGLAGCQLPRASMECRVLRSAQRTD